MKPLTAVSEGVQNGTSKHLGTRPRVDVLTCTLSCPAVRALGFDTLRIPRKMNIERASGVPLLRFERANPHGGEGSLTENVGVIGPAGLLRGRAGPNRISHSAFRQSHRGVAARSMGKVEGRASRQNTVPAMGGAVPLRMRSFIPASRQTDVLDVRCSSVFV